MPRKEQKSHIALSHLNERRQALINFLTKTGSGRYHPSELLRFFLDDCLAVFGLPIPSSAPAELRSQVREMVGLYSKVVEDHEPFEDLLGPIYMEIASGYKTSALKQFFTPRPIADLMTQVTIGNTPLPKSIVRACDPTSGSGVMMLAFCRGVLSLHGLAALQRVSVTCIDIDPICARMSAVQLLFSLFVFKFELAEITVYQGNSLWPGTGWEVLVYGTGKNVNLEDCVAPNDPSQIAQINRAAKTAGVGTQLGLAFMETDNGDNAAAEIPLATIPSV